MVTLPQTMNPEHRSPVKAPWCSKHALESTQNLCMFAPTRSPQKADLLLQVFCPEVRAAKRIHTMVLSTRPLFFFDKGAGNNAGIVKPVVVK